MKSVNGILSRYWGAFLAAGLLLVYGHLAWLDPLLERDDRHILKFLKSWEDVRHLISTGKWGELVVYQPVKDLSLAIDLRLSQWLGHGTFHFTNLVIWALCCWFALRLLEDDPARDRKPALSARIGVLLFAIHPLFVGSVAWVAARKHLLSFLFILIATWELVRNEKPRKRLEVHWRALGWYALALLSHPIQILWPLWVIARAAWVEKTRSARQRIFLRTAGVALVPLALAGIANAVYYGGLYVKHVGASKVAPQTPLIAPLFALGRYVGNLLLPVRLAPTYEPASFLGIIGLLALPFLIVSVRKFKSSRLIASWLIFGVLPLLVVTVRMTQVFVSDTYALAAGFGTLAAIVTAWEDDHPRGWGVPVVLSFVAALFLTISINLADSWKSDHALWSRAAEVEPTGRTLSILARDLLDRGRVEAAADKINHIAHRWPREPALPYLSARILAEDSSLPVERRISALSKGMDGSDRDSATASPEARVWSAYFLAEVYARQRKFALAHDALKRSLTTPEVFLTDLPAVVAELQYFCGQTGAGDCSRESEVLREKIRASRGLYWDERLFNDRLRELDGLGAPPRR